MSLDRPRRVSTLASRFAIDCSEMSLLSLNRRITPSIASCTCWAVWAARISGMDGASGMSLEFRKRCSWKGDVAFELEALGLCQFGYSGGPDNALFPVEAGPVKCVSQARRIALQVIACNVITWIYTRLSGNLTLGVHHQTFCAGSSPMLVRTRTWRAWLLRITGGKGKPSVVHVLSLDAC